LQARGHAHRSTLSGGFGTGVPCDGHWANPLATAGTDSIAQCLSVAAGRLIKKKQLVLSAFEIPDLPYLRYLGW